MRPLPVLLFLSLLALASLAGGLAIGSLWLSPAELVRALLEPGGLEHTVIVELRLPRALAAFAVGGQLALAGALLQVLLTNPLADPYVLGVSGGAAVGALLALLLGAALAPVAVAAFVGALASMFLVFHLSRGPRAVWSPLRLLLTGVVVAAGWGAAVSFLLAVAPEAGLKGMLFWLMGDLAGVETPWLGLVVLLVGLPAVMPAARSLNLLSRGETQAASLGVNVGALRLYLYFAASLLTAAAVTLGGTIGFIGLVVPHLLRLVVGSDHRILLPGAVLLGGSLLVIADTLARTVLAPQQLPVGVLTALLGVPLFLYLLQREARR